MKRRFVILAEPLSPADQSTLQDYLLRYGPWWHWIKNVWLLSSEDQGLRTEQILDKVLSLNPEARAVVFEFPEDVDWSTSGSQNRDGKKISDWLTTVWAERKERSRA